MGGRGTSCGLHQLLPQLLRHSDICRNQQSVCTLLSVSRAFRASISQHCMGRVTVTFSFSSLRHAQAFASWLRCHAKLLSSLNIRVEKLGPTHGPKTDAATAAIASALQAAAVEQPAGLFLQDVRLLGLSECQNLLLQLQSSRQLTCLHLSICQGGVLSLLGSMRPKADVQSHGKGGQDSLVEPLAGLISLRELKVDLRSNWGTPRGIDSLAPALSSLTQLTGLHITTPRNRASLQYLPPQLQHLWLNSPQYLADDKPVPLQLGHLTALTALDDSHSVMYSMSEPRVRCNLVIGQDDVLPSNLQVLLVKNMSSIVPMRGLQQLRKLVLSDCRVSAYDLQLLSRYCTQLKDVQLWYEAEIAESCARAWQALPITGLHFAYGDVSEEILQCVAQKASSLRCLDIRRGSITASIQQLTATIAQLTSLQTLLLALSGSSRAQPFTGPVLQGLQHPPAIQQPQLQHGEDFAGSARAPQQHSMFVLMQAIANLPQLTCLLLGSPDAQTYLAQDACALLSGAPQLTCLKLCNCGIGDASMQKLTPQLTNLQDLIVSHNEQVTDESLACIAMHLQQLKRLDVVKTDINISTVEQWKQQGKLAGVLVASGAGFEKMRFKIPTMGDQRSLLMDIGD